VRFAAAKALRLGLSTTAAAESGVATCGVAGVLKTKANQLSVYPRSQTNTWLLLSSPSLEIWHCAQLLEAAWMLLLAEFQGS